MAGVARNRTNSGVAGALALVMAFAPAAFAAEPAANTNQPQATTQTVSAQSAPSAMRESGRWSLQNPDGVAVLVYMGNSANAGKPEKIKDFIESRFREEGVSKVGFFFEQNDQPSTVLLLVHNGVPSTFYDLTDGPNSVIKAIGPFAKQVTFEIKNGLALNSGP